MDERRSRDGLLPRRSKEGSFIKYRTIRVFHFIVSLYVRLSNLSLKCRYMFCTQGQNTFYETGSCPPRGESPDALCLIAQGSIFYTVHLHITAPPSVSAPPPTPSKSKGDRREKLNKRMIKRPQRDSLFIGEKSPKVF